MLLGREGEAPAGSILRSVVARRLRHTRIRWISAGPSAAIAFVHRAHPARSLLVPGAAVILLALHASNMGIWTGRTRCTRRVRAALRSAAASIMHHASVNDNYQTGTAPDRKTRNSILKVLGRRSVLLTPRNPFVGDLSVILESGELFKCGTPSLKVS